MNLPQESASLRKAIIRYNQGMRDPHFFPPAIPGRRTSSNILTIKAEPINAVVLYNALGLKHPMIWQELMARANKREDDRFRKENPNTTTLFHFGVEGYQRMLKAGSGRTTQGIINAMISSQHTIERV